MPLKLSGRSNLIFNFIYSQETSTRGLVSFILFISNSQPFCRSSSPCWLYPHLSLCTSDLKASGKEVFTTKHLTRGWSLAHVAADSGRVFSTLHNTRTLQIISRFEFKDPFFSTGSSPCGYPNCTVSMQIMFRRNVLTTVLLPDAFGRLHCAGCSSIVDSDH
jgi:hypothetical protein